MCVWGRRLNNGKTSNREGKSLGYLAPECLGSWDRQQFLNWSKLLKGSWLMVGKCSVILNVYKKPQRHVNFLERIFYGHHTSKLLYTKSCPLLRLTGQCWILAIAKGERVVQRTMECWTQRQLASCRGLCCAAGGFCKPLNVKEGC